MAQIPFIEDAYIDDVIKSAGAYDPTLNLTQGVKLRELLKLMRDSLGQGGSGSGGLAAVPVTYAELVNMINGSTLVAGQQYLLTDFQSTFVYSKYVVSDSGNVSFNSTHEVYSGNIEPLLLTALSNNTLSSIAKSVIYPSDEILYTYENRNGGLLSSTRGTILSREDKKMLAYANFDWREVKYKYTDLASGQLLTAVAVNFAANYWGISNSKVLSYGTYGVMGPIVIGSIMDSTIISGAYETVALGNVSNSEIRGSDIINRFCNVSNSTLINAVDNYQADTEIEFNGLDIRLSTNSRLTKDEFDLLKLNGSNAVASYKVLEGATSDNSGVLLYKQYIDTDGVFQTVAISQL